MTAESFAFKEGTLHLWTGTNPSKMVAYVQDTTLTFALGITNQQTVNGSYYDVVTGQRVDVSFHVNYTTDIALFRLFNRATAVHMKLDHAHAGGSAGWLIYSGMFDRFSLNGAEKNIFTNQHAYHANVWSAYGQ